MAQFETIMEIVKFIGKLSSKSRLIARQKVYRYGGYIKGYGPKEMYEKERRNYRYHPRRAAERAQYEKWCRACREATEIVLSKYQHLKTVSRDRSCAYAAAIEQAHPGLAQVADRFHLIIVFIRSCRM